MRSSANPNQQESSGRELIAALLAGRCSESDVRQALATLVHDPLTRVRSFRGDLLRAMMEVPNSFWAHHTEMYEQYRQVVRTAALARRELPPEARLEFWSSLEDGDRN